MPKPTLISQATKANINRTLATPEGISMFMVWLQDPLKLLRDGFLDKFTDLEAEDPTCETCGQPRELTQTELLRLRNRRDKLREIESFADELDAMIDTLSAFDPDWLDL